MGNPNILNLNPNTLHIITFVLQPEYGGGVVQIKEGFELKMFVDFYYRIMLIEIEHSSLLNFYAFLHFSIVRHLSYRMWMVRRL